MWGSTKNEIKITLSLHKMVKVYPRNIPGVGVVYGSVIVVFTGHPQLHSVKTGRMYGIKSGNADSH